MAIVTESNIKIPRGITYTRVITVLDQGDTPVTGLVFESDIRLRWGGPVVASFAFTEGSNGEYSMELSSADTMLLRPQLKYLYDLIYTRSGETTKVLFGQITPLAEITDPL